MSSSAEAPAGTDIVFRGEDGNECEAFIIAIRDLAFAQGREEDHHWMLQFATTRLRSKALRWHAELDPSIKKDWELFVQALFHEYPLVETPNEAEIATPACPDTPTATLPQSEDDRSNALRHSSSTHIMQHDSEIQPRLNQRASLTCTYNASSAGLQIGLLRVVNKHVATLPQYVWWGYSAEAYPGWPGAEDMRSTTNRSEALIISFIPSSAPHQIGCLNSRADLTYLTVYYDPNATLYNLRGCRNSGIKKPNYDTHGHVSKIWNVLDGGYLQASLSSFSKNPQGRYEESKFATTEVHLNVAGRPIRFVKPGIGLPQNTPEGENSLPFLRARIVFEPL